MKISSPTAEYSAVRIIYKHTHTVEISTKNIILTIYSKLIIEKSAQSLPYRYRTHHYNKKTP